VPVGELQLQVVGDYVEEGQLQSDPLNDVGVYRGPWQAGDLIGRTDEDGRLKVSVETGDLELSFFKMTSSHSALQKSYGPITVKEGETQSLILHLAPESVYIKAAYPTRYGEAIYITGETDYLGDWQTAYRLTYNDYLDLWYYQGNLPLGAEFKLVLAEWTKDNVIDVTATDVKWQLGDNQVLRKSPGYYQAEMTLAPTF
jgi:hypothetical protein